MTSQEAMMDLGEGDFRSETWKKLIVYLDARIAELNADNCGDLNEVDTAKVRGRIAEALAIHTMRDSLIPLEGSNE